MSNKQKAWRTEAAKVKRILLARGAHMPGTRYGRTIKRNPLLVAALIELSSKAAS